MSVPDATRAERSLYHHITDQIIAQLDAGILPWIQPWGRSNTGAGLGVPQNAATGRRYSGINILILWDAVFQHGYAGQSWLTRRQARALGGRVRQGEAGTVIVFAARFTTGRRQVVRPGGEPGTVPFLKRFVVFNSEQCDGLPADLVTVPPPIPDRLILPQAEALIRATGADLRIGGDRAFYSPGLDVVQVPRPDSYFEPINWHRTALHELGHWTGHRSRLGRDQSGDFGSKKYAQEELVAEMTSAFTCASLGIVPTVRHADYIGSWLEVLREDNRAIFRAASAASKAADYLLAFQGASGEESEREAGAS